VDKQLEILRNVPLFLDLTEEELLRVHNITIQRSYPKKSIVFTEGSKKEAVFFIQNGLVKTVKTDENGNEHIVSFLKEGDMFPHVGFFNNNPYPANAEAIIDTRLLAIPIHSFELLIMNTPTIAIKVMRVLGSKISDLQEKLQNMTGQDVQDRGLSFLLKLAENYGIKNNDGQVHINLPMTNQEFANAIGSTRETVNRFINQLRKEHLIEMNKSGFVIFEYEALKKWSHK
jgi:CRP/FNR family cyclic AMP-dependent transcriptional regulator